MQTVNNISLSECLSRSCLCTEFLYKHSVQQWGAKVVFLMIASDESLKTSCKNFALAGDLEKGGKIFF